MKHLLHHLTREHLPEIAANSFLNCHARGLHSIMLLNSPEHRVRLFITGRDHVLYRNTGNPAKRLSLAVHPHHCNLSLELVRGSLTNLNYELADDGELRPFYYVSGIHNPAGAFIARTDRPGATFVGATTLEVGQALALPASALHTVMVRKGQIAAWFVYEGREDQNYLSYSYANHDLEKFDFSGLYQRPTPPQVMDLIFSADLLPRYLPSPFFPTVDEKSRMASLFTQF